MYKLYTRIGAKARNYLLLTRTGLTSATATSGSTRGTSITHFGANRVRNGT